MSPFQGQPCSCHQSLSSVPCCEHPWRSSQRVSMQLTRRKWLGLCDCRVKMGLTAAFIHKERKTSYACSQGILVQSPSTTSNKHRSWYGCRGKQLGVSCSTLCDEDLFCNTPSRRLGVQLVLRSTGMYLHKSQHIMWHLELQLRVFREKLSQLPELGPGALSRKPVVLHT